MIQTYAEKIVRLLQERDPLSERDHLTRGQFARYGLAAVAMVLLRRVTGRAAATRTATGA